MQFQRQGMVSVPVILSLIFAEILGDIACPLSILLRGLEALWSPWIGISAPYPCATALTLALVLTLALALALAPARLTLALPTRPLHRLDDASNVDHVEKTKNT
jgi:hypothetical protein